MKRKVLVAFDYAYDGVHANRLRAGRSYEIRDEHVERFEAEGKIEPAAMPARGVGEWTPPAETHTIKNYDSGWQPAGEDGEVAGVADEPDAPGRRKRGRKPKAE